jgi:hypothetical protein
MRRRWRVAALGAGLLAAAMAHRPLTAAPVAFQAADEEPVRALLGRLERAFVSASRTEYLDLLSATADRRRAEDFLLLEHRPGATRAVLVERDRQPLLGTLPGDGYRLVVDAFVEYGNRARIGTWRFDVKRIDATDWRIADQDRLSAVDNLYRLSVNQTRQFHARDFRVRSEDLELTLADGSVFTVETDAGITALVFIGRGDMRFLPGPDTERGQVRLFAGAEAIESRFDAAFIRAGDLDRHADARALVPVPVDARELRRAEEVFRVEAPKAYSLELEEFTADSWWLSPTPGDFLAEIRTRRFDTLTYARMATEPEDVSVFDRRRQRNISVYASAERLATRGEFYDEDDLVPYDVVDYDIDLSAQPSPDRYWLEGQATLRLRIQGQSVSQIGLRLADALAVRSVVSEEYGRLFNLRMRDQNRVLVNLPVSLERDEEVTLTVAYSGALEPQGVDRESLQQPPPPRPGRDSWGVGQQFYVPTAEPSYLYSSRSFWYPQPLGSDYATARIQISVPAALAAVATGEMSQDSPRLIAAAPGVPPRKQYEFIASRPVRYLAFIVSRFVQAERVTVSFDQPRTDGDERVQNEPPGSGPLFGAFDTLSLTVEANPFQVSRGRELSSRAAEIARFYRRIVGDSPYPSFTLALIEGQQPGGHSPGYFAALHQPIPNTPLVWTTDPANFEGYPEFFLAHEIAHQWWGQAVGWRNYHEQWLSEGFAQYFAALYAEQYHGRDVFAAMLRQLRKWALDRSDQGPVYLGYRLGHIRSDSRVFRALVYNKSAAVLHMLRRLIGDDAFFRGIRRFYREARFTKAGTDDLRAAMEAESGEPLERFFARWIHSAGLPRISFTYRVEPAGTAREVVLRFDQEGDIFDLPVTVTLQYADRRSTDVLVPVTDRTVEMRVPLDGVLRAAVINDDEGALAEIRRN